MKKITLELEVRDDFEPGNCQDCPLSYEERFYDEDDGYDYWDSCVLGGGCENCPLEVKE